MKTVEEIITWLNTTYPDRDWDQWCGRLVWNVVYFVSGVPEHDMTSYDPAKDGYHASSMVSLDPLAAPPGAIHWFERPTIEGHVCVELGGGVVLMTGTPAALGDGGEPRGLNYGTTTVAAYSRAKSNPYLGWSRTYGANPRIIDQIGYEPTEKKEPSIMPTIYARATKNSSPLVEGDPGSSRIWAGDDRRIGGVNYSGVWSIDAETGTARRLTMAEWRIVQAAYAAAGQPIPIGEVHGNDIEVIIHAPKTKP